MQISAREAALKALERCRRDGAWSGASIDKVIKQYSLDRRDAALASRLCLGVLQNSSFCDYYIDLFCSRGASRIEPKLRDILRMGVYQLLFLDKIPPRAAVNESVALCNQSGFGRASGLANAVLRRVSENRDALPDIPGNGTAQYLSVKYSHPLWLVERLLKEHDYDFVQAFLASNNSPAGLTIQVNTLRENLPDFRRALTRADISFKEWAELPGCMELDGGNVSALPGYDEGLFYVQDRAARAAVELAGVRPGFAVLDACAAPGGKSFAAAVAMENNGRIVACDIHEKKLALIRSGAERLGIDIIDTVPMDARAENPAYFKSFDVVIGDVPCSGFGVIGKKPEIRLKKEEDISVLPEIQRQILQNISKYVKPGGTLLYSTCTVLRCENQDVVQWFINENQDFELEQPTLGGFTAADGMYGFWPHIDGTDGFFAAKLRRKK